MTTDKMKYHIGNELIDFINSLTPIQLMKMKKALLKDFENVHESQTLFYRQIELKYINYLLEQN